MEDRTIATKGIKILNSPTIRTPEPPEEIVELLEAHSIEKVSGFIHGKTAGKFTNIKVDGTDRNKQNISVMSINKDIETYSNTQGAEQSMSNDNISNTLFNELKNDMREREERSRREISDREARFEKQLETYHKDASAREERLGAEFKEREERIITALGKFEEKMDTQSTHVEKMKTQNFVGNLALFVGMLAIVITLIIAVT